MYTVGETVMYPGTGVCRITDIVKQSFVRGEERTYYVLNSVFDRHGETIYCPVDNENIRLRSLFSREDIEKILHDARLSAPLWIENAAQRKKTFLSILKQGDAVPLLRMIIDLHRHREDQECIGKKMHAADEKIMLEAEKFWNQELACVLQIDLSAVPAFVIEKLSE